MRGVAFVVSSVLTVAVFSLSAGAAPLSDHAVGEATVLYWDNADSANNCDSVGTVAVHIEWAARSGSIQWLAEGLDAPEGCASLVDSFTPGNCWDDAADEGELVCYVDLGGGSYKGLSVREDGSFYYLQLESGEWYRIVYGTLDRA